MDLFLQSFFVTLGALTAIGLAVLICGVSSLLLDWVTGKLSPENLAAMFVAQVMMKDLKEELKGAGSKRKSKKGMKPPHAKT